MKKIIGAGGGGKGGGSSGRAPVESPDNLVSKAFAQVLDLISEGEIEGLVDGAKSIYLNETPVQDQSGQYNYQGLEFEVRNGTQNQAPIKGFQSVEDEVTVGVEVKADFPVVRTITNPEIDAVRVRISIPQLSYQNPSTGDLLGTMVRFRIELQSDGAGFNSVLVDTIDGKSTSKYERSYRVELTGNPPWDIRIVRLTPDSTSVTVQNRTFFESYTEIVDGRLRYPNSAVIAMKVDSSQFTSIPTRAYEVKGIKVKLPTNSATRDDGSLTYSGVWDGTFRLGWTSNPAWIFYDLLTSSRYGLGAYIPEAQVDKWAFYSIGKYCDELVDSGFGTLEPRFSCNVYLQSRNEAFNLLRDIASVFRGMIYWSGGTITASQDRPEDPSYLFTASNVVDGRFTYQGSSAKTRHTVALIGWNDPEDFYRQKLEVVEDVDAIARYGIIQTETMAFGCTSRGQANRLGRWILYSEGYQTETVTFGVGVDGALLRPGQVIKVQDPMRAGERKGGRIKSATTTTVEIDQSAASIDESYLLSVLLPNGIVEERAVLSVSGNTITVSSPFSIAPQANSVWVVASLTLNPQTFRVVNITEGEGGVFQVTALAHDDQKYDLIEKDLVIEPRVISVLGAVPSAPMNVKITETLYEVNGEVRVKATVSWDQVAGASSYIVSYQRDSQNPIELPATRSNDIEILNAEPGTYTVRVYAISAFAKRSPPGLATATILGKSKPPGNVLGFSLIPMADQAYLSWIKSTDLDVLIGGSVRVRFTPDTVDPQWKNSVDIMPALAGSANRAQAPLLSGSYMAKFVDSSGFSSDDPAIITTTVPAALALNVVETVTESPTFPGLKSNMDFYPSYPGLALSGKLIDDVGLIDDQPLIDFAGGVWSNGTYDFDSIVDLSQVYSSRLTANIAADGIDATDTIDQRAEFVDRWVDLDGAFIDDVNAELWVDTTLEDPSDPLAVWTGYKRFFVGEYSARGLRFQLRATSGSYSHNIVVRTLSVTIDMPDRTINLNGLISGAATLSVVYPEAYKQTPAIGITAYNLNSGDTWAITNKTRSGFDITFRNSAGALVSRTFDVIARGYGRQLN